MQLDSKSINPTVRRGAAEMESDMLPHGPSKVTSPARGRPRWATRLFRVLPAFVLILGLLATVYVYEQLELSRQASAQARFDREVERTKAAIVARMGAYEDLLHSANALFAADESVTREQWRSFVAALPLAEHYPGLSGVGMIVEVPRRLLTTFENNAKLEGVDNYQVHPRADRALYLPVRYIEPVANNRNALGFDLAADPAQLAAAEWARDNGTATLTPRITIGSGPDSEPGFLLLVPVYHRGMPQRSVEERRAALLGWVFAPLRSAPLMQGILGPGIPEIDVEIFDGSVPGQGDLLYDSDAGKSMLDNPSIVENQAITVVGHPWKIGFTTLPAFDAEFNGIQSILMGAAGGLISLLLAGVTLVLVNNQSLAESRAEQMTSTVRENEHRLRRQNEFLEALQATRLGLLSHQSLAETLHHIVERAAELAGTRHGYLFQLEHGGGEMAMTVGTGFFEQRVGDRIKPGQSVAGVAWQSAQPLLVNDYPHWPGRVPSPVFDQLVSLAGVPLRLGDKIVGVIGLGFVTGDTGSFVEEDMSRLAQVGELASLALENAQLFDQAETELAERTHAEDELRQAQEGLERRVEERTAELATLNRISQVISEQSDSESIAREVGQQLRHVFHCDSAFFALYDKPSNVITMPYLLQSGKIESAKPVTGGGHGLIAQIIRTGLPAFVNGDWHDSTSQAETLTAGAPARSFLGVPILSGDQVTAVVGIQNTAKAEDWGEAETRLLMTIAANVGVALDKANLLKQAQQRARQEYLARSIVSDISTSIDPDTILRKTARQLSHALGASHAVIRIGAGAGANGGNGEEQHASKSTDERTP